jgi:peptide/nickel transport system substrate-binding protein
MRASRHILAIAALTIADPVAEAFAAPGDDCIKILGYESSAEKQSMDPASLYSGDDAYHIFATYNRLVDLDGDFRPVPELAESWESSADGRTWTFHLRPGVTFHDGSDFDAADVVFTFQRLFDPALPTGAKQALTFLEPDGVGVVDALTVTFTAKEPAAELPVLLANRYTNIVAEGAKAEDLRLRGNGTGPFVQQEFTPGGPMRLLKKNARYWKPDLPKAECLRITVAPEAVAAVSALKAGDADLVLNVDPSVVYALKDDPNIQLLETAASNSMTVSMWTDTPPFDDVRVRRAMKLVVDRQAMVDAVLLGYGEAGADNPVPVGSAVSFVDEAPAADVARAKQLLAEAGHPTGLRLDMFTAEGVPGMVRMAQVYARMAAAAGIHITVNVTPAESYWDDVWLKKPLVTSSWSMRPPVAALSYPFRSTSDVNETHWTRDDYDRLLSQAGSIAEPAERAKVYKAASKLLAEEGGIIVPMFVHQVLALRKGCSGYSPRAQNFAFNFEQLTCKKK